jgi:membrane protease YdiL (CAAX protease family)
VATGTHFEEQEEQARRRLPIDRKTLVREVWLVFALSLGASGVGALIHFTGSLTAKKALSQQAAPIITSAAPGRPWLDLTWQLFDIAVALVPVLLVGHFMRRSSESFSTLGFDLRRPKRDLGLGAGLAALVGGAGLGLYLLAYNLGVSLQVQPSTLPDVWWRVPVLVLSAAQNGILEEVIVAGYLLHRLRQFGWSDNTSLVVSALTRGSYHFYQGFGGFVGNVAMGLLFGRVYQRTGRTMPLVIAHTLIDIVAFVGYAAVKGKAGFGWLP